MSATRLHEGDLESVTEFCQECSAFFTLVAGETPAAETALHLLVARPPEVAPTQKHVIGFTRNGKLVAVVDLLEGFPVESDWYAGLLLLAPHESGSGLGTLIWDATETWIRAAGGRHVRLIVQQQNPGAARFWRSAGFMTHGEVEQVLEKQRNLCWRLEKGLHSTVIANLNVEQPPS